MFSLIKGIKKQPSMLDLFSTYALTRTFTCDKCGIDTAFPIIDGKDTYCESCYEYKNRISHYHSPPFYKPSERKCDCGAEKSNALGHYGWCGSGKGK